MNLGALPELLLAWVKTQSAALLQGSKSEAPSAFNVGQQYEGKVLDQLPGGRHLVQVASQKLDMGLPKGTQSGDSVRLTFLSAGPRPTFVLNQSPVAPVQQVQLSSGAQQASALMRLNSSSAQLNSAAGTAPSTSQPNMSSPATSAPSVASSTAATLASKQLVQSSSPSGVRLTSGTANNASPVSGSVAANSPAAQSVAVSASASARPIVANVVMLQSYAGTATGLAGAPLATINSVINAGLIGQAVDGVRAAIPAHTTLASAVATDPADPSSKLLPTRLAQTLRESGMFYEAHLARWTKNDYPFESLLNEPLARMGRNAFSMQGMAELGNMPEDAARMAGRQLGMLEGAPFVWQGFAWPGQWMQWLVEERSADQETSGEEVPSDEWQTDLRLTLPSMGAVHAHLALRKGTVNLSMTASDSRSVDRLRAALPSLQSGLEAAGLQPVNLLVEQGDV